MGNIVNRVSYSHSIAKMLKTCGRLYWYQKYGAWNGWWQRGNKPPKGGPRAEEIYVAKQAETIPSWAGKIVHDCAEFGLKLAMEGRPLDRVVLRESLLNRATKTIDIGLKQASGNRTGNPKRRTQLIEKNFGHEFDEDWLRDRVRNRILVLVGDDDAWTGRTTNVNLYLRAIARPNRIVLVEELLRHTHLGIDVYLKMDLMMRAAYDPASECVIVDWKTGRKRYADENQAHQYVLWAGKT